MERVDFNKGWTFAKKGTKTVQTVTLPHDAMLHENRSADAKSGSAGAYFEGGSYVYTKEFVAPTEWEEKTVELVTEGIYKTAEIFCNDVSVGKTIYGYSGYVFDLTEMLRFGEKNMLRIEAENEDQPNSRWYSGAGIYRPVRLEISGPCRIERDGVTLRTVSCKPAVLNIKTAHTSGEIKAGIYDGSGKLVAEGRGDDISVEIPDAVLWSDKKPYLYRVMVTLYKDGVEKDRAEYMYGLRTVTWDSRRGLCVNDEQVKLRGGCIHHDNGVLGACAYPEAEERKVRILKANGFNAIRSAHNPCSEALLDACDKYGIYVMDETWDMWYRHKSKFDYAGSFEAGYEADIRKMVNKDKNHSSVIMYSIGNEVSEPAEEKGRKIACDMTALIHKLDDSRAVTIGLNLMIVSNASKGKQMYNGDEGGLNSGSGKTQGMNSTMFNLITQFVGTGMNKAANGKKADRATSPVLDTVDVAGYNYASGRYPLEATAHPDRVIVGSETFPSDIAKNWDMVEKYPYLIGDFMWTAIDYLGEAGIGAWAYTDDAKTFDKPYPWLLGATGAIDIVGNADGEALRAQAVWRTKSDVSIAVRPANHPKVKVIKSAWRGTNAMPLWSYRGCDGNPVIAEVYGRGAYAELYCNGRKIAKKKLSDCQALFKLKYETGELKAVLYDADGNRLSECSLHSSDGKLGIRLSEESKDNTTGDIIFIPVDICGENGVTEGNADERITVTVSGGELLGFGSANPRTEESFTSGVYTTYYGRALAVIRKTGEETVVTARGETLAEVSVKL